MRKYILELSHDELWNLLEAWQEIVRNDDFETIDTTEQKLIDLFYGHGTIETVRLGSPADATQ